MAHNLSSTATLERFPNPGYEVLIDMYWMKDVQVSLSSAKNRYYLPAKALLSACAAIDGYVNVVGSRVDPQWVYLDEESTHIKERLAHIYKNLHRSLDLNRGIWADVLLLFSLREELSRSEGHLSSVSKAVARRYRLPRKTVYDLALRLQKQMTADGLDE